MLPILSLFWDSGPLFWALLEVQVVVFSACACGSCLFGCDVVSAERVSSFPGRWRRLTMVSGHFSFSVNYAASFDSINDGSSEHLTESETRLKIELAAGASSTEMGRTPLAKAFGRTSNICSRRATPSFRHLSRRVSI